MSINDFLERIASHKVLVGIIGMGYVGLPLVRTLCAAGFRCLGFDIDEEKVQALNEGRSYIKHIPPEAIKSLRDGGRFTASSHAADLGAADVLIICVPTPLTRHRQPDLSFVENTSRAIRDILKPGCLVVLESTTYPGTTREVVLPILEEGGRRGGRDFYLAYSPEREDPGRRDYRTDTIPKVVGAIDHHSLQLAVALYSNIIRKVVPVSSCEVAEASKILENVYRSVNIALVNELKLLFDRMGIDIWEVIDAASTKPFGFQPFYPGPGLGGHCIPIDPFYLTWKARQYELSTRFIELAGEINASMPQYVVHRVAQALNERRLALNGSRILVLGLAYKSDVDDVRESPAIAIIELLRKAGAKVDYNDPHVPQTHKQREHDLQMKSEPLSAEMLAGYDCVVIATAHSDYDIDFIVTHARLIVDTRNATAAVRHGRHKIVKA